MTGPGRLGGPLLLEAIATHDPNLARLNSPAEQVFYDYCVNWDIDPLPEPNVSLEENCIIDGVFWTLALAVEIHGKKAHRSAAQMTNDADKGIVCRQRGLQLLTYTATQLNVKPHAVRDDLLAQIALAKARLARDRAPTARDRAQTARERAQSARARPS
jgi:hypothetical protein